MGQMFGAFRQEPFPTGYGPMPTAVTADVLETGIAVAFATIYFSFMLAVVPGRSLKERVPVIIRTTLLLFMGCAILISLYGLEWVTGKVVSRVHYKHFSKHEVRAEVGLHVGIHAVNITLKGKPVVQPFDNIQNETINFNEQFGWSGQGFSQGRLGFGPQAGQFQQDFWRAQLRGIPLPILTVAEFFTVDGEDIRWGRLHRQAGIYTEIVLWMAFGLWGITCFIFGGTIQYGAIFMSLTSLSMVLACVVFAGIRQHLGPPLTIPFQEGTLSLHYGWTFYLCLLTGIGYTLLALATYVCNMKVPKMTASFFGMAKEEPAWSGSRDDDDDDEEDGMGKKRQEDSAYLEAGMSQHGPKSRSRRSGGIDPSNPTDSSTVTTNIAALYENATGAPQSWEMTTIDTSRKSGNRSVSAGLPPTVAEDGVLVSSGGDSLESGLGRSPKTSIESGDVIYANVAHSDDSSDSDHKDELPSE